MEPNNNTNTLHIKNMVCSRCIKVVSDELQQLGIETTSIELGKVILKNALSMQDLESVEFALKKNNFELLDDRKSKTIEKIKILIIEGIRKGVFSEMGINVSQYLSDQIHIEYTHLSNLFSSVEGKSIERFVILQKIELVKELISYDELSIKQIADQMGYSSLQALSNQFKKETGLTPTDFKKSSSILARKSISAI